MRMVTPEGLSLLSQANPIAELAAERGLHPQPIGRMHVALCPFHGGEGLRLYSDTGRFRCFECREDGNVFGLVAALDGISFLAVLDLLAARAAIDLDQLMPGRPVVVPLWALTPPAGW
jgi:DNA primase